MLTLPSSVRVYLAAEPVDLRRGHDGLVALVRNTWRLNPFDGHLFVFLGRRLEGKGSANGFGNVKCLLTLPESGYNPSYRRSRSPPTA